VTLEKEPPFALLRFAAAIAIALILALAMFTLLDRSEDVRTGTIALSFLFVLPASLSASQAS